MSSLNLFFPFSDIPRFLLWRSIHFSFTHQQMQLNPHSNSLYVHINYSALHLAQTPYTPPFVLRLPWQPRVAALMSEPPPRTLMQALGQVMCTAAGHRLTPKNKMAVVPPHTFCRMGESLFEPQTKEEVHLCSPGTFLF